MFWSLPGLIYDSFYLGETRKKLFAGQEEAGLFLPPCTVLLVLGHILLVLTWHVRIQSAWEIMS